MANCPFRRWLSLSVAMIPLTAAGAGLPRVAPPGPGMAGAPSLEYSRGLDARFDCVGTRGALYVDGGCETVALARQRFSYPELFYVPEVYGRRVGILRDELESFVRCVREGETPAISGADGRRAVEVARAIQSCLETGMVVSL